MTAASHDAAVAHGRRCASVLLWALACAPEAERIARARLYAQRHAELSDAFATRGDVFSATIHAEVYLRIVSAYPAVAV